MNGFTYLLVGIVVGCALGTVGNMDYQRAIQDQEMYCSMVHEGHWPDYNQSYKQQCNSEGKPK